MKLTCFAVVSTPPQGALTALLAWAARVPSLEGTGAADATVQQTWRRVRRTETLCGMSVTRRAARYFLLQVRTLGREKLHLLLYLVRLGREQDTVPSDIARGVQFGREGRILLVQYVFLLFNDRLHCRVHF